MKAPEYVDVRGLTLDQIVEIGTKASGSLMRRKAQAYQSADGGVAWDIPSRGSVMTFQVSPVGEGAFRVVGFATTLRLAQVRDYDEGRAWRERGLWSRSLRVSNVIYGMLGIPYKPRKMLRLRSRVLNGVTEAARHATPSSV